MSRNILSLFDHSLTSTEPYYNANFVQAQGYNVFELDILNNPSIDIKKLNFQWFVDNVFEMVDGTIDGIISMPPCTDFTVSGAQYWKTKDLDGRTESSLELIDITLELVDVLKPDWWVLENPVGRLPKLRPELGKPFYFHPYEFAGYLDIDLTQANWLKSKEANLVYSIEEIEFIKNSNLYTKKTGLWGEFTKPVKKELFPIKVCKQGSWLQALGGSSVATKNKRSETPMGFAQAFFEHNP